MKLDRRDALRLIAAGGAALGFSTLVPTTLWAATPDLVVATGGAAKANVRAALAGLGGMGKFVSKGDNVVIKPNIGFGNVPIRTSTTDPEVVRTLAEEALNAGAKKVMVLDNPCHKANIALEISGIKKSIEGLQDTFAFTVRRDNMFREVPIPKGKALKKQKVALDILEADTVINVPVAKSHGGAMVSFGLKAWMGAVKERKYWHVWVDLHQAIADMATIMRPKFTMVDATRALVTGGPGGPGRVDHLKTIVAGMDPVAVDAYALGLAPWGGKGYRPEQIPHIVKAAEHGLGTYDLKKLNILKKTV